MSKIEKVMILGNAKVHEMERKLLSKKKPGADEIVMKVGFIAVALGVFTLWKTGILQLVTDWIGNMQTQSASFWN